LDNLLKLSQSKPPKPLILVTKPIFFQNAIDFYLNNDKSNLISGIVLLKSNSEEDMLQYPDGYSDDKPIPNSNFGYDVDQSPNWNSNGSSNQFTHFKIPIYLVYNRTEIEIIIKFYNQFNLNYFANLLNTTANDNITIDLLLGSFFHFQYKFIEIVYLN
jgi:hypothetical protein